MDWKEYYKSHTMSAEEAVKLVPDGANIVTTAGASSADKIIHAMANRAKEIGKPRNFCVINMLAMGDVSYLEPEYKAYFRHRSIFGCAKTRASFVGEQGSEFVSCHFHDHPGLFRNGLMPVDAVFVAVSKPNEAGQVSMGVSIEYTMGAVCEAIRTGKPILAEVNSNMPEVPGETYINVRDIAAFVETDAPLPILPPTKIGDVEKKIGSYIADFIKDGDCLQLGIGAIPDAVLSFLTEKNDIGIHTEMLTEGIMGLAKSGVITGHRKTLHKDKIVLTFGVGSTRDFYTWMNHNSMLAGYPVDYVNDPCVIAKNDNLISINSTISVDLLGQAASDSMGPHVFSGQGGQIDFVRGAAMSKGGKSFLAFPSTASHGKISRIAATLLPGQPVTTHRADIEYVVTEYGCVRLKGLSNQERADALISIAHPDFRDQLKEDRKRIYGW